jgi:hypothetical protein
MMQVMMKMVSIGGKQPHNTGPIRMTTADNVRLWLVGDPYMQHLTRKAIRANKNKGEAAMALIKTLRDMGVTETPDGAKITYTSVRRAITLQEGY